MLSTQGGLIGLIANQGLILIDGMSTAFYTKPAIIPRASEKNRKQISFLSGSMKRKFQVPSSVRGHHSTCKSGQEPKRKRKRSELFSQRSPKEKKFHYSHLDRRPIQVTEPAASAVAAAGPAGSSLLSLSPLSSSLPPSPSPQPSIIMINQFK